jgi:hypothetical protein
MITCESCEDILQAHYTRCLSPGKEPLLTPAGAEVLLKIVAMMKPMPQAEIDEIMRCTLNPPQLQLRLA